MRGGGIRKTRSVRVGPKCGIFGTYGVTWGRLLKWLERDNRPQHTVPRISYVLGAIELLVLRWTF